MAMMLSSTSPVPTPLWARVAAYVGKEGRFHGAKAIPTLLPAPMPADDDPRREEGREAPWCTCA